MPANLYLGEMLVIARETPELAEEARQLQGQITALSDTLAKRLAAHHGVAVDPTSFDLGRFAASFSPAHPGQAMPERFKDFDTEAEWDQ